MEKTATTPDVFRLLRNLSTCLISDSVAGSYVLSPRIRNVGGAAGFAGPVKVTEAMDGDNLGVWEAIAIASEGDVLVVATNGWNKSAIAGGNVVRSARYRGVAAMVTDGCVRDVAEYPNDLAIFAEGVSPKAPVKEKARPMPSAVRIGEVAVSNGDILVGDGNGIVGFPLDALAGFLRDFRSKLDAEARQVAFFSDPETINDFLASKAYRPRQA